MTKKKRRPSIKTTILKKLSDNKSYSLSAITDAVKRSGYQSRTGQGQMYVKDRTHEALYRLVHTDKKVVKPKRNSYRLRKKK